RATFWPETASRWLSPARRKSETVRGSIPPSSPRTKPRASSASRGGIPRPSAESARRWISPVCASAIPTATAAPIATGTQESRPVFMARSGLKALAKRFHRRRPDPAHLVELVDRGEPSVPVAELDDVAGGHRADPVDRLELP